MSERHLASIEAFLAVAETGGFGLAARELGLTQSTISRRIVQLEERLGVRLLARTTRNVTMTAAGESFAREARDVLAQLAEAEVRAGAAPSSIAGMMRITMPTALGRAVVVPALCSVMSEHPKLRVELDLSDRYVDLQSDRYDMAIRLSDEAPSGWVAVPLGPISGRLYASPAYMSQHDLVTKPDDLSAHRLLTARTYTPRTTWTFRWCNRLQTLEVAPAAIVSDFSALADMARAGAGIVALPAYLAESSLADGSLIELLPGTIVFRGNAVALVPHHLASVAKVHAVCGAIKARMGS